MVLRNGFAQWFAAEAAGGFGLMETRPICTGVSEKRPLRRGWTTGACATAAAKAAYAALLSRQFPEAVEITLPGGLRPRFALAETALGEGFAQAGVIKDAGDDPDITHGALLRARVRPAAPGQGVVFRAGEGVGIVTRPGLPIPPGEPAINPAPRRMIAAAIAEIAAAFGAGGDVEVEISIAGGARLAERTLNPRLGIVGGLSVLGTTGVVVPYSCSAWIAGIRQGIDVARAAGFVHIAAATGRSSEAAVQRLYQLPEAALIDMGNFVGGVLNSLRRRPLPRLSLAGGIAKMTKLAQGHLDLHSARGSADLAALARLAAAGGVPAEICARMAEAATVAEAFALAADQGPALARAVASAAWRTAAEVLRGTDIDLEVLLFSHDGALLGRARGKTP